MNTDNGEVTEMPQEAPAEVPPAKMPDRYSHYAASPRGHLLVEQASNMRWWTEVPGDSPAAKFRFRAEDGHRLPNEVWLNMGCGGLGDTLLGLCAVKGYKLDHPDKVVVYRFNRNWLQYVMMFDGYDGIAVQQFAQPDQEFPPPDGAGMPANAADMQMNLGYQLELLGKAQITRLQRYCRNLGYCTPALPRLLDPAKLAKAAASEANCVVLAPFAASADRTYPLHAWVHIEHALHAAGYDTLVTGTKRGPLIIGSEAKVRGNEVDGERLDARTDQFHGRVVIDPPADKLAGIMLTAKCVVANDSGIAHLAAIMGTPTIILGGWSEGDKIYDFYPSTHSMQGVLECGGCWTKTKDYDPQRCNRACASLGSIDPSAVIREVMARVPVPPARA